MRFTLYALRPTFMKSTLGHDFSSATNSDIVFTKITFFSQYLLFKLIETPFNGGLTPTKCGKGEGVQIPPFINHT
jgi:hypothetical protein